jgi:DinB superfamily
MGRRRGKGTRVPTKAEMVRQEDAAWALFESVIESLNAEQILEPGYYPDDGWSTKDLIAHVGSWMAEAASMLERIRFGTYGPDTRGTDDLNKEFFEANRDLPLDVVRAECHSARARILQEWDALPEVTTEALEWFEESAARHCAEHQPRLEEWAAELRARAGATGDGGAATGGSGTPFG